MFRPSSPRGPATEEAIQDPGRIISLSDGIFAFAMTLLVLSLVIPTNVSTSTGVCGTNSTSLNCPAYSPRLMQILGGDLLQLYAYVISFIIIAMWWTLHHALFAYVKRYDVRLMWLNLLFLLGVAVSPFTLGVWISFDKTAAATELYGAGQALVGLAMLAMVFYATEGHRMVDPRMNEYEVTDLRLRASFLTAAFAATVPLAYLDGGQLVTYAQATWGAVLILQRFVRRRNRERLVAPPPPAPPTSAADPAPTTLR